VVQAGVSIHKAAGCGVVAVVEFKEFVVAPADVLLVVSVLAQVFPKPKKQTACAFCVGTTAVEITTVARSAVM
jgi:hypothetical protein